MEIVFEVDTVKVLTLRDCPRCSGNHRGIMPARLRGDKTATHFVFCPSTSEPVLLTLTDEAKADVRDVEGKLINGSW